MRDSRGENAKNVIIEPFSSFDRVWNIPLAKGRAKEKEKKEIIRHKTIYREDLFLMRSRIELSIFNVSLKIHIFTANIKEGTVLSIRWFEFSVYPPGDRFVQNALCRLISIWVNFRLLALLLLLLWIKRLTQREFNEFGNFNLFFLYRLQSKEGRVRPISRSSATAVWVIVWLLLCKCYEKPIMSFIFLAILNIELRE